MVFHNSSAAAAYTTPLTFALNSEEVLVDIFRLELMGLPFGIGPSPRTINWPVPGDPVFAGWHVYTQAAGFGGGEFHLTCAYDCTVGY